MQTRSKVISSIILSDIQVLERGLENRLIDEKKEAELRIETAKTKSEDILLRAENEAIEFKNETYQLLIDRLNQSTSLILEQTVTQIKQLNQAAEHQKADWLSFMLAFVTNISSEKNLP